MKILTTAVFSVIIMQRTFHPRKWRALVLLVLGVTLVSNGSYVPNDDDNNAKEFNMQYLFGVAAVLLEVSRLTEEGRLAQGFVGRLAGMPSTVNALLTFQFDGARVGACIFVGVRVSSSLRAMDSGWSSG